MGPEWIIIGIVVAIGVTVAVLVAFYRKLSAIERAKNDRTRSGRPTDHSD
jgi:hypothetical protein